MLIGRQPDVERWCSILEVEDAFNGIPDWVMTQAWVHFTPQEQAVLKRWRRMCDVKMTRGALERQERWRRVEVLRKTKR